MTNKPPSEIQTLIEDHINGFNTQNTELFLGVFGDTAIITILSCIAMLTSVAILGGAIRHLRFSAAALLFSAVALLGQGTPASPGPAQPGGQGQPAAAQDTAALAKATQNPVASLISVPFQNSSNFGVGPYNRTQDVLNIQPVIPIRISENWNLITRIIQPIVWQPYPASSAGGQSGFGDMNPTFFLSPVKPSKLIWGAGPAIVIPTATSALLGQGKLSMGPSVVALTQPGPWTSESWSTTSFLSSVLPIDLQ